MLTINTVAPSTKNTAIATLIVYLFSSSMGRVTRPYRAIIVSVPQ
jgi:hypothetical protein